MRNLPFIRLPHWNIITVLFLSSGFSAPTIPFKVLREIPHDRDAFTQGLQIQDGMLWESTGSVGGGTRIRQIDPANGHVLKTTRADDRYFGEGLATDGITLYQLSWQNQCAYLFRYPSITPATTIPYKGEGWGLALDKANQFWMSNGSDTIVVRDCQFREKKRIPIKLNGKPVHKLNELEFAEGSLWANVWYCDSIMKINPSNGSVTGILNLSQLRKKAGASSSDAVVNGIAAAGKNQFWVTGKLWPKIYLIEIMQPTTKPQGKTSK